MNELTVCENKTTFSKMNHKTIEPMEQKVSFTTPKNLKT